MTVASGAIYCFRNDRLGGRLIALVNAIRLANIFDAPLFVYWHQDQGLGNPINNPYDLFDAGFVDRHFIDAATFAQVRAELLRTLDLAVEATQAIAQRLLRGQSLLVDACFDIQPFADEAADDVRTQGKAIWNMFPFSAPIAQALPALRDRIGAGAIAYHIRRGDLTTDPTITQTAWPGKYVPDDYYDLHIEQTLRQGSQPILFSDDKVTIGRYAARYPALVMAKTLFDRTGFTQGQQDFLELYAISLCQRIVAPTHSAFSAGAAALGGGTKVDPITDLSVVDRNRAGDSLLARLQNPEQAAASGLPGETGQQLVHLIDHLQRQSRADLAAKIVGDHIAAGLNIAFLYPRWIELLLESGDPTVAIAAGQSIEGTNIWTRNDFAATTVLRAVAHVLTGDTGTGAALATTAIWRKPSRPIVSDVIGAMLDSGILHNGNFLATSPATLHLWRETPNTLSTPALRDFVGRCLPQTGLPATVPVLAPLQWDWPHFLRVIKLGDLARQPRLHAIKALFTALHRGGETPDSLSLEALVDLYSGQRDGVLLRLVRLGRANPDQAMVQHRLSVAAWLLKKQPIAISAAEAAVAADPHAPSHRAWRAMLRLPSGDIAGARSDLDHAIQAGLAIPRLQQLLAIAAERTGETAIEKAAHDAAVTLAPRDVSSRLARAAFHIRMGDPASAKADLDQLEQIRPEHPDVLRLKTTLAGLGLGSAPDQ